jgi:hypothetical protein
MHKRAFLLAISLPVALYCSRGSPQPPVSQSQQHPLLRDLHAPPLNLPIKDKPIPGGRVQLPPGRGSLILVTSKGQPFRGTLTQSGRMSVRSGRIEFVGQSGLTIEIFYRLPPQLAMPQDIDANGDLLVSELSDHGGPNRRVSVRVGGSLMLGEISLSSSQPVIGDFGDDLRLRQRAAPPPNVGPAREVPIDGFFRGLPIDGMPIRKTVEITGPPNRLQAYIETSRVTYSSKPRSEMAGSYVLHAWMVGQK